MPKGKKKNNPSGFEWHKGRNDANSSDEESFNENASVISATSDGPCLEKGVDDVQVQNDIFEDTLIEAIDGLTQKSAQGRTNCLRTIVTSLSMKYVPEFVMTRKLTITDCIEKCLKKGRGLEQEAAAELAALLPIQLCSTDMSNITKDLLPLVALIANDNSMSLPARSKCCMSLGVLSFCGNREDLVGTMHILENIFSSSYHKGDGSVPSITQELAELHCAAISSWSLLLTISDLFSLTNSTNIALLGELLDSAHLYIRMAAGEAIAILLEQQRKSTDNGSYWEVDRITLEKLRMLATDNDKRRAKKDKKTQRSSFRHILKYVELDEFPNLQIRFGTEILTLDSWCKKKQYDAFSEALGSGINRHLGENDFIREIMDLGERISSVNFCTQKQTKLARHLLNAANFKVRSVTRAKHRDKRLAVFET